MKILLSAVAIFAFSTLAFAQTVVITPKKTVYTRKGKIATKEKRTFTVTYPVVSGAISAPVKKKLENTISYWRVFETTLAENLTESNWLSDLSYEVNYNKNGILDISLTQEGAGAYPDSQTYNLVIDLKTGNQVKFDDVFRSDQRAPFAALVGKKLEVEKRQQMAEVDKEQTDREANESIKESLRGLEFTAETFNEFTVGEKGVTILYDAGFPHAIQAVQPDGRYFFTWAEVRSFIKPNGLFGRFAK